MEEQRLGRQTPTQGVSLPYEETKGEDAIALYQQTGRTAQEWQSLLVYDLLAVNEDGLWTHTKYGYSVPRRNGKNEVVAIRELYGLQQGEHIMHTAHRTSTTHSAWERLYDLLTQTGAEIVSAYRAFGKEHLELDTGGKIEFRTRTSKGGLGEGFDLLIIDEAQEYQDDQESALKYVVSDSKNPQTIFCGTPTTPVSSGTVFVKYRNSVLTGGQENSGWAEWSVEHETDPKDREAWYETNPSLGTVLTERKIADEATGDRIDFNIQRLGLWIRYNQKSAISEREWDELKLEVLPELKEKLFIGVKYGHSGENVSMALATKTPDGKIFVEAVDCAPVRNGDGWIVRFLKEVAGNAAAIVVDGASGQGRLAEELHEARVKKPIEPTVKEVIDAGALFEQAVFGQTLCHMGQPSLRQAVSNCEKRAIGSNGGFGYRSIREGVDISVMESVILAHWACMTAKKEKKKQKISY